MPIISDFLYQLLTSITYLDVIQMASVILGLSGNLLINRHNANGFKLWIVSNALAIIVMAYAHLWWMMIMFAAYLVLAIDGLRSWKKCQPELM